MRLNAKRKIIMSTRLWPKWGNKMKWSKLQYKWWRPYHNKNKTHQKQLQVIFHRGAKVKEPLDKKITIKKYDILIWKENDRAIASPFRVLNEIQENSQMIRRNCWEMDREANNIKEYLTTIIPAAKNEERIFAFIKY